MSCRIYGEAWISRVRFVLAMPLAVGLIAACVLGCNSRGRSYNIVIYLVDTFRADHTSIYGYAKDTTPNLARLSARSVVFEQCFAQAPWTAPSVASLMTSTFPSQHGVLVDGDRVPEGTPTLASWLRTRGYRTASFFANGYANRATGLDRGMDLSHLQEKVPAFDDIEAWLRERQGERFFLYIHTTEPHDPYVVPDDIRERFGVGPQEQQQLIMGLLRQYRDLTKADFMAGRPVGTTDTGADLERVSAELGKLRTPLLNLYDSAVAYADANIGKVVTLLQSMGVWDDTLFVVVADHGEEFGEHRCWQHDQSFYNELVRVPMVIHFPGDQWGGQRVAQPVRLMDVAPTALNLMKQKGWKQFGEGRSFLPVLEQGTIADGPLPLGERINLKKYNPITHRARGERNAGAIDGEWKGILNKDLGTFELYHLTADPGELADVSGTQANVQRARDLRAFLESWAAAQATVASRGRSGAPKQVFDPETERNLRSLGYVR